jgi:hypothetical protein
MLTRSHSPSRFRKVPPVLDSLIHTTSARSRSISPENPTGAKGAGALATTGTGADAARELGVGWKISPSIRIEPGQTVTIADITGPGKITSIWMTATGRWRSTILRMTWDDQPHPSVEAPLADFFCMGWNKFSPLVSEPVCVNPGSAFNCYWPMPFRKHATITIENRDHEAMVLFYQINYELDDALAAAPSLAMFHAQFRHANPVTPPGGPYLIADIRGRGHYVGTYLAWQVNNNGWWGEGEVKFYLDGDTHPTICTTGTEDYFAGSYNFEIKLDPKTLHRGDAPAKYMEYTTPHAGLHQVLRPDGLYSANTRFGLYRWHLVDPIRFERDLKVDVQCLGWRPGQRYHKLRDRLASVAFWYQEPPSAPLPTLPSYEELEVI